MTRLIVVCEHPSLHRGFAVVGRNLADYLFTNEGWQIDYLGRCEPTAGPCDVPYPLVDVDPLGNVSGEKLINALRRSIGKSSSSTMPALLLSIGTGDDQLFLLELLDKHQLRHQVRFLAYFPIDYAPLPPLFGQLLAGADLLVPYTNYALRVMEAWCFNAGVSTDKITRPIPHGVRTEVFQPLIPEVRREIRRHVFGMDDESLLIGYFGRNSGHKRSELAVRIFHLFAKGRFTRCNMCQHVEAFRMDPINLSTYPPSDCNNCGGYDIQRGTSMPAARLYLHTDLPSRNARIAAGGWDLELLVSRLGIADQILWNRNLSDGIGLPLNELASRMGACDIHLLPYEAGGWELTVLETGACGVANVITDFAAPPEYAAPFSRLIPVSTHVFEPTGVRGLMDVHSAIAALVQLVENPSERRALGECGVRTAKSFAWPHVGKQWHALLTKSL